MTDHANKIITRHLLKQNYRELILIFSAFTLMVFVAYFSIGNILRDRLYERAKEIILTAGANVRTGLSEAEAALINSYYIVQGMIEQNESRQDILDYLTATTEWMQRRDQGLLKYYGIYGYINGEYYDGVGMEPGDDFIPQTRLWYQTAIRSGTSVGYTTPYTDWHTGDTIFSAVRNIDVKNGDLAGILAVDFNIDWLVEYAGSLSPAAGGYGILLSQNMTLIAHPDSTLIGSQLHDLGGSYEKIALTLRGGGNVFARRIQDSDGGSAIVFFSRIYNGWYVGTVIPYFSFYRDLYISAFILVILGLVLSLTLCYILLRLSAAKMRADKSAVELKNFNDFIRTAFSTYVSDDVVKEIIADPSRLQLGGTKRYMTAIFTDIRDFSAISERLDPEDLVSLLNCYLSAMSDVILTEKGTIDKFEGDAIIAFFGAPIELEDHSLRACISAITIKKIETEFNKAVMEHNLSPVPFFTRIGINTGDMVAGNIGTENKKNYTIMGNAVNLAARLESINKQYGTSILASEETVCAAGDHLLTRKLDRVRVVGINEPVRIYELLDTAEHADSDQKKLVEVFHGALDHFERRNWKQAEDGFKEALSIKSDDNPSKMYYERTVEFIQNPPDDSWDGVYNLTSK